MKTVKLVIALTLIGFSSIISSVAQAALVGETGGSFAVSNGMATYSIPLTLPEGVNKLTPQLSLNYDSKRSLGIMGVGWSLAGLLAISRCPQTLAIDGRVGFVELNHNDRFCLNGQRLILTSGAYAANASEYRTEIASYQKITAHGQAGNGPAWFEVRTKSGEILTFATSADSRVEAQGKSTVLTWLLTTIQDRFGNYIFIEYDERQQYSEAVPSRIIYTQFTDLARINVNFSYTDLPQSLISQAKTAGSRVAQSRYLSKVEVKAGQQQLLRSYTAVYETRNANDLPPLLTSFQECIQNQHECLPAITFAWDKQQALAGSTNPAAKPPHLIGTSPHVRVYRSHKSCHRDHTDFFSCSDPYTRVYSGNTLVASWREYLGRSVVDINNDSLVDFVIHGKGVFINQGNNRFKNAGSAFYGDYNGDGGIDKTNDSLEVLAHQVKRDLLRTITNAGEQITINYMDGSKDAAYVAATNPPANHTVLTHPGFLVKSVTRPDGIGGTKQTSYRYGGGTIEHHRRGSTGFRWLEKYNPQSGVKTRTDFRQDFPFTGRAKSIQNWQHHQLLSQTNIDYSQRKSAKQSTVWSNRNTVKTYSAAGVHLATVITTQDPPDAYGNVTKIQSNSQDHRNNHQWKTITINTYQNTPSSWSLGRLTRAVVTHTKDNQAAIVRTAAFAYNNQGILTAEIAEPDAQDSRYKKVSYQYDPYGNKTQITRVGYVSSTKQITKTTQKQTRLATYNGKATKEITVTNTLGHQEIRYYSLIHGGLLQQTGPNGLTTRWQYDEMGRKIREDRADGTWTRWTYALSDWHGAKYKNSKHRSGSAPVHQYYDSFGRETRKVFTAVDGRQVYADTRYDALGRKQFISRPYYAGSAIYGATLYYDAFSRLIRQDSPGSYGQTNQTLYSYGAFSKTVTDPLGRSKTTYKDAQGKVIKTDQEGAIISHQYDALDRLVKTTNAKNQHTTIAYDILGRKVSMTDPVMGTWRYRYDSFDNLIEQTDAKGQQITTHYDPLGRKISQTSQGGLSTWAYDRATGKGIGKIHKATSPLGHQKVYSYDNLGRPIQVNTAWQGQNYLVKTSYDSYSRVSTTTYPNNLEVQNVYHHQNGHLVAIRSPKSQVLDYQADFILKQFIKAQRFASLAALEVERYRQRARIYRELSTMHIPYKYANFMDHTRYVAIRNILSSMANNAQASAQQLEESAKRYRQLLGNYRSALNGRYGDAWSRGKDYLRFQAKLQKLKAQKQLQIAQETQQILAQIAADKMLAVNNYFYKKYDSHWGLYYLVTRAVYNYTKKQLEQWQQQATRTIRQAQKLQNLQANYLTMLGSNAQDQHHITWYRIAQTDGEGRITQALYGNSLMSSWDYDPASGQLLGLQSGNMTMGKNNDIQYLDFQYDAINNLISKNDHLLNRNESISYDRLDRIHTHAVVQSTRSWTHTYSYNNHGDILYGPAGQYLYGDTGNQKGVLLSVNGNNLSYDANGNISGAVNGTAISWNLNNKPTRFSYNGKTTAFRYDGEGNRFLKTNNGVASIYIGKLYEKNLASGDEISHIYFAGTHIASYEKKATGQAQTSYMHKDALGNIDVVTNQHATVIARYAYDAFGKRHQLANTTLTNTSKVARGYTGHEHFNVGDDPAASFIHMNGRVYDQSIGRFLSADPHIQAPNLAQSHNRYAYVLNNPYKYTDPSGYLFSLFKKLSRAINSFVSDIRNTVESILKNPTNLLVIGATIYTGGAALAWMGGSGFWASVGAGAISGFVGGFLASGGDLDIALKGAVMGAISGAITGAVSLGLERAGYLTKHGISSLKPSKGFSGYIFRGLARGTGSALINKINNRNAEDGFYRGFVSSLASDGYRNMVGYDEQIAGGKGVADKNCVDKVCIIAAAEGKNNVGFALQREGPARRHVKLPGAWDEGGIPSNTLNLVPQINASAVLHDTWMNHLANDGGATWYANVITMLPAFGVTYMANYHKNVYMYDIMFK